MIRSFQNWARTHRSGPVRYSEPQSEAELADRIRRAAGADEHVKVVGAGHSWSDIAVPRDTWINLDRLDRVVAVDAETRRVRVQAGIRLHQLIEALAAAGLALPSLGSVTAQSIAGAISTGTHGSSLQHGNLAHPIVGMRLIDGTGQVHVLDADDERLAAARVGLGALGVITELTIQCVPAFTLTETVTPMSLDEAAEHLPEIARSAEFVKLWWLPPSKKLHIYRYSRTDQAIDVRPGGRWVDEHVINRFVFPAVLRFGALVPAAVAPIHRVIEPLYFPAGSRTGDSAAVLTTPMPARHRETEYAVPLDAAGDALRELRALIDELGVKVNFIQELRFVPADDAWLSPAFGRDTCQIGAYMAQAPKIDEFMDGFGERMKGLGGRAHWGKEFRASTDEIASWYPRFAEFDLLRRRMDPDGTFDNPFVRRVFGETWRQA